MNNREMSDVHVGLSNARQRVFDDEAVDSRRRDVRDDASEKRVRTAGDE